MDPKELRALHEAYDKHDPVEISPILGNDRGCVRAELPYVIGVCTCKAVFVWDFLNMAWEPIDQAFRTVALASMPERFKEIQRLFNTGELPEGCTLGGSRRLHPGQIRVKRYD